MKNSDRNIDQYMLQQCGYESVSVTATDHAYQDLPGTVPAGITLSNQGTDAHQVLVLRANDGVTQSFAEILNLPPEQQVQVATAVGSAEADPGETATVFLRLTPGRYGAADFVAQGTTTSSRRGVGLRTTPSHAGRVHRHLIQSLDQHRGADAPYDPGPRSADQRR